MENIQGMQVYVESEQDWINFVRGNRIVSFRHPITKFYKKINISGIEIVSLNGKIVEIEKKY